MTPRMGTLVSLSTGALVGVVASFVPMVFGPLAFPEAISGPTRGEDIVAVSIPVFFFVFGASSFLITRKLVARFIDYGTDTNRILGGIAPHPSESLRTEISIATVDGEKRERLWVTLGAAILSICFMVPADIVELFSWLPKRLLDPIPSSTRLWTFIGLCEIAVGLGDRFYLPLALVLNIFLLFRKQAPVWLKVSVWILLLVALLGAVRVETEIKHIR